MVNYFQMALCAIVILSILVLGIKVYQWLDPRQRSLLNRYLYLGEVLLLGATALIGAFLFLSLVGLYRSPFLLAVTGLNFLWLFDPAVRHDLRTYIFKPIRWDIGTALFLAAAGFFIFRNCSFLTDVDSFSNYLFTQQLWLQHGSSLVGTPSEAYSIFLPQFDYVLDSLGLALWGHETLYPALINLFWRVTVLLLLFGYTKYRLQGSLIASAAVLLTLFNEHFFYSGVGHSVLLNGALLALLFASIYNFWEAQRRQDHTRLVLAFIFLSQLLANKYQMMYVTVFVAIAGVLIQKNKKLLLKAVWGDKIKVLSLAISVGILSMWFLRNYLMTGDPIYPGYAGQLHAFGWTQEKQAVFMQVMGGISVNVFLKYMSFLFIWPGIKAAKLVLILVYVFPMALFFLNDKVWDHEKDKIKEIGFWLGTSMLVLLGICMMSHQDSRFYRYPIAIFSFTAVFGWYFFLVKLCRLPTLLAAVLLLAFAALNTGNEGYHIAFAQGGNEHYPTIKENMAILKGQLFTRQAIEESYPAVEKVLQLAQKDPDKFSRGALDMDGSFGFNTPQFWLPRRPVASLWCSNLAHWDSYGDPKKIVRDFHDQHIDWVIAMDQDGVWGFIPVEEFANGLSGQMRYPSKKFFAYSHIPELDDVNLPPSSRHH